MAGDVIEIVLADGTVIRYEVTGVKQYPVELVPMREVLAQTADDSLTLITCGGAFGGVSYTDRLVLRAVKTGVSSVLGRAPAGGIAVEKMPKPSEATLSAFAAVAPGGPGAVKRKMFGQEAAFVNGNMFMGLFGDAFHVRLSPYDHAEVLALGGRPFAPGGGP
ncbi:MAG: TfoX/Sxy family protein [Dehalococcoidia bacterium]